MSLRTRRRPERRRSNRLNTRITRRRIVLPPLWSVSERLQFPAIVYVLAAATLLATYLLRSEIEFESKMGAALTAVFALLPGYLWISGKAKGLPLFPIYAGTYLLTFSLPVISGHPTVMLYTSGEHYAASFTVALFLMVSTAVWYYRTTRLPRPPRRFLAFPESEAVFLFQFILLSATTFQLLSSAGWLGFLPSSVVSILRAFALGLNVLAVFLLSYRLGEKKLKGVKKFQFVLLLSLYCFASAAGLTLIASAVTMAIAIAAFVLGRKKIPWLTVIMVGTIISLLQFGKLDMRQQYWTGNYRKIAAPLEYFDWYREWLGYGVESFFKEEPKESYFHETNIVWNSGPLQRMSLAHILLMIRERTGPTISYLNGKTYRYVPQVIIPRFINPQKVPSHHATHILSVHYGLQDWDGATRVTIGWGLLNEAYANFGMFGVLAMAAFLGLALAQVSRWSLYTPLTSARTLFSIAIFASCLQTEWTSTVFAATLSQLGFVIFVTSKLLMRRMRIAPSVDRRTVRRS